MTEIFILKSVSMTGLCFGGGFFQKRKGLDDPNRDTFSYFLFSVVLFDFNWAD